LFPDRNALIRVSPASFALQFIPTTEVFQPKVEIGVDEGLKHDSAVFCDDLISLPKRILTNYIGSLSSTKIEEVNIALRIALAIE